ANDGQGAAYVWVQPAGGWAGTLVQTSELTATDGGPGDQFGFAVAIAPPGTIVVGALSHTVGTARTGAAYEFTEPAFGWGGALNGSQTAGLTPSDGAANDRFGAQVGAAGNTVIAGAFPHQVGNNTGQGAVYTFDSGGRPWKSMTETQQLTIPDG